MDIGTTILTTTILILQVLCRVLNAGENRELKEKLEQLSAGLEGANVKGYLEGLARERAKSDERRTDNPTSSFQTEGQNL